MHVRNLSGGKDGAYFIKQGILLCRGVLILKIAYGFVFLNIFVKYLKKKL